MASSKYAKPASIDPGPWNAKTAETIDRIFDTIFTATQRAGGSAFANLLDVVVGAPGSLLVGQADGTYSNASFVATVQRVLTNNGGIPTWAQLDLTTGVTGRLPLANVAQFSATQLLWGRNSIGAGTAEEVTLTQLLDWILTPAQGDVLYRGAAVWKRLAAGTLGWFLQTQGAAADPTWAAAGGAQADNVTVQNRFELHGRSTAMVPVGIAAPATAGTLSLSNQADSSYVQWIQTGTTIDLRAGFHSTSHDVLRTDHDFTFEIVMQTGATITQVRWWFGISNVDFTDLDDQGGTTKYWAIRFSTIAADGGWVGLQRNGTTQAARTATIAAVAANTKYLLRIRRVGTNVFYSVNNGTEVVATANFPAAGTDMGFVAYAWNAVAGSTHPWLFSRLRCIYGS